MFEMIIMRLCYASLVPTPFETSSPKASKKNNEKIMQVLVKKTYQKKLCSKNQESQ